MTTKLGILGGTFDPVHLGHLILAEHAREELGLERILFIPAAAPPHKQDRVISDAKHRLAMLQLATVGNECFEVGDWELKRTGLSYTVDTLTELKAERPDVDLHLLLGADMVNDLPTWKDPERIVQLAKIIGLERGGTPPIDRHRLRSLAPVGQALDLPHATVKMPLIELSGSDLRRRVQAGLSIRYRVPAAVAAYIEAHRLYQSA